MTKKELLNEFDTGMTVGQLIERLKQYDKDMIVVNARDKAYLPVNTVEKTKIDYCYDEIISKEVISIW